MVAEITGEYTLLLPTIWVSFLCLLLNRRDTLYIKQVATRLDSPAHRGDYMVDVLEGIQVRDVYDPHRPVMTVHEGRNLDDIVHLLARTHQRYFPVVDQDDNLVGIFSSEDVRTYLFDQTLWQLAIARDVMRWPIITVCPNDDLNSALRRFTALNLDELPVVDDDNPKKLRGMVRRKELIAAYNQRLMEFKKQQEAEL